MNRSDVVSAITSSGVVGIVRTSHPHAAVEAGISLLEAGLPAIEVSLTTPDAIDVIRTLAALGLGTVGAGTVRTVPQVHAAREAGASFIVSPVLSLPVLDAAHHLELATLPGIGTPTEAIAALDAGADFAKLFPASSFGPKAAGDFLTALPEVPLVPTGGVALEDVPAYIKAGAVAVGLGSALTAGDAVSIRPRIEQLLALIQSTRDLHPLPNQA